MELRREVKVQGNERTREKDISERKGWKKWRKTDKRQDNGRRDEITERQEGWGHILSLPAELLL